MKKLLFALFLLFPYISLGQIIIPMEKQISGTYLIPCKVNDVPMKFLFDTGASAVCISLTEAMFLIKNGYIQESDIKGTSHATIANGDIVENTEIVLRKIEIGGIILKDVEALVSHELKAPLLLGQSAIQRLGKITLEDNILTIHTGTTPQNQQNYDREELDEKIRKLRELRNTEDGDDYEVLEIIEKIEKYNQLNEFELFCKTMSLSNLEKLDEAISAAQSWIDRFALETDSLDLAAT